MDDCGEARVGFVVARGDAAELLDLAEEVLDQMAPLVHLEIAGNVGGPIGLWRDHGQGATLVQVSADPVAVEGLVRQQGSEIEIRQQRSDADAVVSLPRQQDEAHEIAQRIHQSDDLGRQAAARTADGLSLSPPFAPVPCWCTRTMVPSRITYSKSASSDRTVKICSKTPRLAHLRNRWKTEFHLPKDSGRSRQGAPTRATHSTASRNSRLSAADCPGSPTFPGRRGASRSHCSSRKTIRSKATSLFRSLEASKSPSSSLNVNRP